VTSVAFVAEDALLASTGADKTMRLWKVATGKESRRIERQDGAAVISRMARPWPP